MDKIQFFVDKSDLDGTGYFELSPGRYEGKHWQNGCLFFDEEIFGLIEPIFKKCIPNYDHYDMNDAGSDAWRVIVDDLEQLSSQLRGAREFEELLGKVGFAYADTEKTFCREFDERKVELAAMIDKLVAWANREIEKHGCIAVLGM